MQSIRERSLEIVEADARPAQNEREALSRKIGALAAEVRDWHRRFGHGS